MFVGQTPKSSSRKRAPLSTPVTTTPLSFHGLSHTPNISVRPADITQDTDMSFGFEAAPLQTQTSASLRAASSIAPSVMSSHVPLSSQRLLLENDQRSLMALGGVPEDLEQILAEDVNFQDPESYRVHIDPISQVCLLVLIDIAYVWTYKIREQDRTPIFLESYHLPTSSCVPWMTTLRVSHEQVGCLVVTSDCLVRLWDNILMPEHYRDLDLALSEGEYVTALMNVHETSSVFLATNLQNVVCIQLGSRVVRQAPTLTLLHRPRRLLQSVTGWFGSAPTALQDGTERECRTNLISVPLTKSRVGSGEAGSMGLFLFTRSSVVCWAIGRGGQEKFCFEQELKSAILDDVRELEKQADFSEAEIVCAASSSDGRIVALAAVQSRQQQDVCKLVLVWYEFHSTHLSIHMTKLLTYDVTVEALGSISLRLTGSPVAFILGPDFICLTLVHDTMTFEEMIPFREDALAYICAASTEHVQKYGFDKVTMWLYCHPLGVLRFDVHVDNLKADQRLQATSQVLENRMTAHVRSALQQAIFFGSDETNPISFDMAFQAVHDYSQAVVELSSDVLRSKIHRLSIINDVKILLQERSTLLNNLLQYMIEYSILEKVNPEARLQLLSNADKLEAALELWHYHISLLDISDTSQTQRPVKLLDECIELFLAEQGNKITGYTALRQFFKVHVEHIGRLVEIVGDRVKRSLGTHETQLMTIFESNRIILSIFKGSFSYLTAKQALYALSENRSAGHWTTKSSFLQLLQDHFTFTAKAIEEYSKLKGLNVMECQADATDVQAISHDLGAPVNVIVLFKIQLAELSDVFATLCHESLASNVLDRETKMNLSNEAVSVATSQFQTIAHMGLLKQAYRLSEKYKNFYTLINLAATHEEDLVEFIVKKDFLRQYGEDFANTLFQWLLGKNRFKSLFSLPLAFDDYLFRYLMSKRSDLLWIVELRRQKYTQASEHLIQHGSVESNVDAQEVLFSLAKLSALVDPNARAYSEMSNVHLDFCVMYKFFRSMVLATISMEQDHAIRDEQILNAIMTTLAKEMKTRRPHSYSRYKQIIGRLLANETLSLCELLDAMTLNFADTALPEHRFALSLELYVRVSDKMLKPSEALWTVKSILRRSLLSSAPRLAEFNKSMDASVVRDLQTLPVYDILQYAVGQAGVRFESVSSLKSSEPFGDYLKRVCGYVQCERAEMEMVYEEMENENNLLDMNCDQFQLESYYQELLNHCT